MDAVVGQGVHPLGGGGQDGVGDAEGQRVFYILDPAFRRLVFIQAAGVKARGVVPTPPGRPKGGSIGFTTLKVGGGGGGGG